MLNNKRASLELSIRAIVIVVLAMTLLGLGLGFVKNMFSDITETTGSVSEQIRAQILEDLRTGDRKLSFPNTEVKLGKGESKNLAVGVKNTGEGDLNFNIEVVEIEEDGTAITESDLGNFLYNRGDLILGVTEANVYPIKFSAENDAGTGIFQITVVNDDNTEYASKTFFITVQ